jgi:hypothetical protein
VWRKLVPWGWFSPRSRRNLLARRRWGFLGRLVSFGEWKEPPGGEKVGSLGRAVSPKKTLWPKTMMSLGIGCNIVGIREWGFLGQYRVAFLVKGGGRGPRSGLFSWVRCNNCKDVGVFDKRRGVRLKNKWG